MKGPGAVEMSDKLQGATATNCSQGRPDWALGEKAFLGKWCMSGTGALGGSSTIPGGVQDQTGRTLVHPAQCWQQYFEVQTGLNNLQRTLPTKVSMIL